MTQRRQGRSIFRAGYRSGDSATLAIAWSTAARYSRPRPSRWASYQAVGSSTLEKDSLPGWEKRAIRGTFEAYTPDRRTARRHPHLGRMGVRESVR